MRGPRVKSLKELTDEKDALIKKQRERAAIDKQTVLENLHLLRLREMFPDAKIECSEHVANLIEAFLRRHMVGSELREELELAKLLAKKPRPSKIMKGLAVVRPTRYEYRGGEPLAAKQN